MHFDINVSGDDESPEGVQHAAPFQEPISIDLNYDGYNSSIGACNESIKHARNIIVGQWREYVWDQKNINMEKPPTTGEVLLYLYFPTVIKF